MSINQYVTYTRVSTKGQGESGLGLEAQDALLSHYLSDEDIAKRFTETASAKTVDARPVLQEAIAYCLANNTGLAVAKVDRLSRITEHALDVYSLLGGMLYSCDIPCTKFAPMDKFTLTIFMAIADRERELIGIRTSQALQAKYAKESWSDTHKNNAFGATATAKSAEARQAKSLQENMPIFEYICNAMKYSKDEVTFYKMAKELNEQGKTTIRGGKFTQTILKRIYERGIESISCEELEAA